MIQYIVSVDGMFNTNVQCYQNISQVLLTSAFILWPTCTFRYSGKNRCGLRFFGVFLCGLAVFGPPLRPPSIIVKFPKKITSLRIQSDCLDSAQQIVPWVPEFSFSRATRSFGGTGRHVFGRRPKTRTAKPREKPRAQSALIYSAIWALTLSLICQSNRQSQD